MSEGNQSKTPTSIKIASRDASKRAGTGTVDPGPGDPSAAPSEAPQLVDIPEPPSPSQLVVKSSSKNISEPPVEMVPEENAPRSSAAAGTTGGLSDPDPNAVSKSPEIATMTTPGSTASKTSEVSGIKTSSIQQQSSSQPSASRHSSAHVSHHSTDRAAPVSSQQMSASRQESGLRSISPAGSTNLSGLSGSKRASSQGLDRKTAEVSGAVSPESGSRSASPAPSSSPASSGQGGGGVAKKTTRFRYHKRVTVKTKGKTSPKAIMDKVNYKDHKAGITPSAIEEMDPQELMKRAGIKETKKGLHWRVRLRQTERITKNGKTITQTKIAYRDSEGHKRVKTTGSPNCEKCGKQLEECECKSVTHK